MRTSVVLLQRKPVLGDLPFHTALPQRATCSQEIVCMWLVYIGGLGSWLGLTLTADVWACSAAATSGATEGKAAKGAPSSPADQKTAAKCESPKVNLSQQSKFRYSHGGYSVRGPSMLVLSFLPV